MALQANDPSCLKRGRTAGPPEARSRRNRPRFTRTLRLGLAQRSERLFATACGTRLPLDLARVGLPVLFLMCTV